MLLASFQAWPPSKNHLNMFIQGDNVDVSARLCIASFLDPSRKIGCFLCSFFNSSTLRLSSEFPPSVPSPAFLATSLEKSQLGNAKLFRR